MAGRRGDVVASSREQQVVLRLPPALADHLSKMKRKREIEDVSIDAVGMGLMCLEPLV
jgi:hypothetical protein